jgi:excisionase family DNA binding protein
MLAILNQQEGANLMTLSDTKDVAKILKISTSFVRKLTKNKTIPHIKIGRSVRYDLAKILEGVKKMADEMTEIFDWLKNAEGEAILKEVLREALLLLKNENQRRSEEKLKQRQHEDIRHRGY